MRRSIVLSLQRRKAVCQNKKCQTTQQHVSKPPKPPAQTTTCPQNTVQTAKGGEGRQSHQREMSPGRKQKVPKYTCGGVWWHATSAPMRNRKCCTVQSHKHVDRCVCLPVSVFKLLSVTEAADIREVCKIKMVSFLQDFFLGMFICSFQHNNNVAQKQKCKNVMSSCHAFSHFLVEICCFV